MQQVKSGLIERGPDNLGPKEQIRVSAALLSVSYMTNTSAGVSKSFLGSKTSKSSLVITRI